MKSPQNPLQKSSEDWLELLRKAPGGYLLTDPKGKILRTNETLLEWLGYERDELEGKMNFQDLLPIGDRLFYETKHVLLLKLQTQVNEVSYSLICKDEELFPVLLNSAHSRDESGAIVAFQFIMLPFSDRKKYELELVKAKNKSEEASEAKSIFLSTITHEIRTPIHAILNAGKILLEDNPTREQEELLEVINFSSHNLLELINSVLDLNRIDRGKAVIRQEAFDIHILFEELLKIYRPLALGKNVTFQLNISQEVPRYVIGDRGKIQQVFTNLIGNAIKFTDSGSIQLSISVFKKAKDGIIILFELQDTGIGMRKGEIKRIFDPFTQANDAIHNEFGGSGLGLTIAQRLLKIMDSKLEVTSYLGKGSKFSFQLKMVQTTKDEVKKGLSALPLEKRPFSNLRILIVDDIYSNILIIKRLFKLWKLDYKYARNGMEALNLINTNDFDLILMDINMPEMDGYETTKKIRALSDPKYQQIPIIALSAYDSNEVKYNVERSGMNELMQKPFGADQLYRLILKYSNSSETNVFEKKKKDAAFRSGNKAIYTDSLCAFFNNEEDEILEYFKVAVKEIYKGIDEFKLAEEQLSVAIFKSAVHSKSMLMSMFKLDQLKDIMSEAKEYLMSEQIESFKRCNQEIIDILRDLAMWMEGKMNTEEVICTS